MTAFDDWIKYTNGFKCVSTISAKEGWEAALRWVRIKIENYRPEDVCYFIDEELDGE